MNDSQKDPVEQRERVYAAWLVGGFFFLGGIVLYFAGQGYVLAGTSIEAWWVGIGVSAIGAAMIVFPKAGWVQRGINRLNTWPGDSQRRR